MKAKNFIRFLLLVLVSLSIWSCSTQNSKLKTQTSLQAGITEIDITPPIGHRMAGYFDERLATDVHDPLFAKAIVLDDGQQKIAFVFCDLVGVSLNVTSKARAQASQKTGIPVANILICATHSHTGPLFDNPIRHYLHDVAIKKFGKDPTEEIYYPDFLAERLAQAIVQANSRLAPANLDVGIGQQLGLSFNRRFHMKNGTVAFNPGILNSNIVRPAGPIDPDVGIVLVRPAGSPRANPIGGITVFAMHCDTVGSSKYSADYPYYIEQTLQKAFGPKYISAFGAGTCGDINHINVNVKDDIKGFARAERLGSTLGKTVLKTVPELKPIDKPSFNVRSEKITASFKEITPEQVTDARAKMEKLTDASAGFFMKVEAVRTLDIAEKGPTWPLEVQVFRLDSETAIVGLPCEIFVELGLAIKAASPFKKTIVMSICNDRPSYVPTKKAFTEGSYEITNARVKSGTGEQLVETAIKLLREAKN